MFIQSSSLCKLPHEIFENIVLELISHDSTSTIVPLLQTCKQINHILAFPKNSHLYSRVFHCKFDSAASARRLGTRTHHSRHLAHQLAWYSSALRCIRRADIYDHGVLDAFWACFALMSENDGKNRHHLEAAGLPDFVDEFLRNRLYEDNASTNGWPNESPINSLALWLLWFTSTEERLKAETTARRNEIIRLVLPFVIVPFRYPSAHAPHNHFTMPLTSNSDGHLRQSILPAHGAFPLYRSGSARTTHFYDRIDLEIGIPLASTAAKLIFFSRRQVTPIGVPIHLPLNRQHAIQLGFGDQIGPTQEDVHELNQHNVVKHVPATTCDDHNAVSPSSQLDDDWFRLTDCIYPMEKSSLKNTHYTYGSASGLWQGRILVPTDNAFTTILQHVQMPEDFTEQQLFLNAAPLFMRLREYHCIDPQDPVPTGGANDGFDDGISNAWIPTGVQVHEDMHEGKLTFQHHGRVHVYEAYRAGFSNSHDEATCRGCQFRGTCDIVYREHDDQYLAERSPQADEGVVEDDVDVELLSDEDGDEDREFLEDASARYDSVIDTVFQQKDDEAMDEDADTDADLVSDDDSDEEYSVQRKCNGVLDIALVGETDFKHGQAWNHYKFYGRVREWDGLIALVRIPAHPHPSAQGLGVWVFSGYIVGGQNFVGTWRALGSMDPGIPSLESSFAMTRREEGVMQ